jgi:type VI secretion system protein ImpH
VEVEQFRGRWVPLSDADKNRIGLANCRLGIDLTVGDQVYDLSGAFDIAVGPVDWQTYLSFVPDGDSFAQTRALVELYRADPLSFNVEVRLRAGQVPDTRLSSDETAGRLGYTSWIRTEEMPETSVVFDATRAAPGGGGAGAKEQPARAEAAGWA